jgi:hypothetical protein
MSLGEYFIEVIDSNAASPDETNSANTRRDDGTDGYQNSNYGGNDDDAPHDYTKIANGIIHSRFLRAPSLLGSCALIIAKRWAVRVPLMQAEQVGW